MCSKEFKPSSNFLRHVAKDHLNIPLYQCPICKGHGGQDAYDVRSHMLRVHGHNDVEPLSNIEANAEQIERMYQRCFPGRRLKSIGCGGSFSVNAVRRAHSTPNEANTASTTNKSASCDETRVICKECGMDMKTEDRQIHVYRHHLKVWDGYELISSDLVSHIYTYRITCINPRPPLIIPLGGGLKNNPTGGINKGYTVV